MRTGMDVKGFFSIVLTVVFLATVNACGATHMVDGNLELDYIFYYLTQNGIYKIVMPEKQRAALVYSPPKGEPEKQVQISGLTCGPDNALLFHLTAPAGYHPGHSPPLPRYLSRIVTLDVETKNIVPEVDLKDTSVRFPVLSSDGSRLAMTGRDSFFVKDMRTRTLKYYQSFATADRWLIPSSWSPNAKTLALYGGGRGKKPTIYFFDLADESLNAWKEGLQPHFSPSGRLIAFLSSDYKKLIISDKEGNIINTFSGPYLFKDLNGWAGEHRLVFTMGVFAYVNDIGIADLKTNKTYRLNVPASGEITGICWKDRMTMGDSRK